MSIPALLIVTAIACAAVWSYVLYLALSNGCRLAPPPVPPELSAHVEPYGTGFRTSRVTAEIVPLNIGGNAVVLRLPLDPMQCDRSDWIEAIRATGASIVSAGGSYGAPVVARYAADELLNLPGIVRDLHAFVVDAFNK